MHSHTFTSPPPSSGANPATVRPIEFATSTALMMFGLLPVVEMAMRTSRGSLVAWQLTNEHLLVIVNVPNRVYSRIVGAQCHDRKRSAMGSEPRRELRRVMLRIGEDSSIAGEDHIAARLQCSRTRFHERGEAHECGIVLE